MLSGDLCVVIDEEDSDLRNFDHTFLWGMWFARWLTRREDKNRTAEPSEGTW